MKSEEEIMMLVGLLCVAVEAGKGHRSASEIKEAQKSLDLMLWVADLPSNFEDAYKDMKQAVDESIGSDKLIEAVRLSKKHWSDIESKPMVSSGGIPKNADEMMEMLSSGEIRPADNKDEVSETEFILCVKSTPENRKKCHPDAEDVPCASCGVMVIRSPKSPKDKPCRCFECGQQYIDGERQVTE
jgi:hypothetical protein